MNTKLLRLVADAIEKFPQNFSMDSFYTKHGDTCSCDGCFGTAETICQTTACIAGWAVILDRGERKLAPREEYHIDWEFEGQRVLGLTDDQASCLFMHWNNDWWYDAGEQLGLLNEFNGLDVDATTTPVILRAVADGLVPTPTNDER
jgi:hypothetical protein